MASEPIRDHVKDQLLTPKNSALIIIDYDDVPDLFPGLREPFWSDELFPEMVGAFVRVTFSQLVQMFHFLGDVDLDILSTSA